MSLQPSQTLAQILDAARWAPSGDNTQPWRFSVESADHLVVLGSDTRTHCVYDLDGHPSQMSIGALLETITIAATAHGQRTEVRRRPDFPDDHPTFDVRFIADPAVLRSSLIDSIPNRSVQRQPLSPRALTADEKAALSAVLAPGYSLRWMEGWGPKWQAARLMFANAKLRLTMHEAYLVHRDIIEWNSRFSQDRVPDQALGADSAMLLMMRWAMADWRRVQFMNRWLAGTWLPRLRMDLLPSLMCGAHMVLLRDSPPRTVDDYVDCGAQVQRLWLTATRLGLQHQPEITPLVFSRYVRDGVRFTASADAARMAASLARTTENVLGDDVPRIAWIGRLGAGKAATARSIRRPLKELF